MTFCLEPSPRQERLDKDFEPTPANATIAALKLVDWQRVERITEPCAGDGAILKVLRGCDGTRRDYTDGRVVMALEIDEERAALSGARRCDALDKRTRWGNPDLVIMNPPFTYDLEFCGRALHEVGGGQVLALVPLAKLGLKSWRPLLRRDDFAGCLPLDSRIHEGMLEVMWLLWDAARRRKARLYL